MFHCLETLSSIGFTGKKESMAAVDWRGQFEKVKKEFWLSIVLSAVLGFALVIALVIALSIVLNIVYCIEYCIE